MKTLLLALLMLAPPASPGEPAVGTLRVKTDVSAAEVYVDGKGMGITPATIPNVPAGARQLTIIKDGYKDHVQQVEVKAGETVRLFVVLKPEDRPFPPLPAKYMAFHKHASGICRGEITVTTEALDYRSIDSHDVFHIPLQQIRSVSRSYGASIDFKLLGSAAEGMGLRIEGPGRSYTFWAFEDKPDVTWSRIIIDPYMMQKTKELYDLVFRLWGKVLDKRKQTATGE